MTNTKTTKRALLASVLSLLLCFSMLVGSTFAWFTDSASTGVNTITAGNLDVELYYSSDKMETWVSAEDVKNVFTADKWEPGYTQVGYFQVKNAGSLALDYKVATNVVYEKEGKNQVGDSFKLSEYLQFGFVNVTAAFENRDDARDAILTPNKFSNVGTNEVRLEKGETQSFAIVVWMPEETGNVANHDGVNKPEIQFGINVIASQADVERDSFDEKYDTNAKYPDAPLLDAIVAQVGNATDLKNILETAFSNGGTGDVTVTLTKSIDVEDNWDTFAVPNTAANITIDGAGYTVSNLNKPLVTGLWGGYGTLTFKNLTIDSASIQGYDADVDADGTLSAAGAFMAYGDHATKIEFINCKLTNSEIVSNAKYTGGLIGYSSALVEISGCEINNCTITGAEGTGGLAGHLYTAEVSNSKITGNTAITSNDDGQWRVGAVAGTINTTATFTGCTVDNSVVLTQSNGTANPDNNNVNSAISKLYGRTYGDVTIDSIVHPATSH